MGIPTPLPQKQVVEWIRSLDIDDLYLLSMFSEGYRSIDISRALSISQPAITARNKKITEAVGFQIFESEDRKVVLSPAGKEIASRVSELLKGLELLSAEFTNLPETTVKTKEPAIIKPRKPKKEDEENFGETTDCGYLGSKI